MALIVILIPRRFHWRQPLYVIRFEEFWLKCSQPHQFVLRLTVWMEYLRSLYANPHGLWRTKVCANTAITVIDLDLIFIYSYNYYFNKKSFNRQLKKCLKCGTRVCISFFDQVYTNLTRPNLCTMVLPI